VRYSLSRRRLTESAASEAGVLQIGNYRFLRGLATAKIDRDADSGGYWEPNVWMHHAV
jgi:hypothetical protein